VVLSFLKGVIGLIWIHYFRDTHSQDKSMIPAPTEWH